MLAKRIIPCLDVKNGRVVKGSNFINLADVADPVVLAEKYSKSGADELVFYDITASAEGRKLFTDVLKKVAEKSATFLIIYHISESFCSECGALYVCSRA